MLRKIGLVFIGIVVLAVGLIAIVPRLIDFARFEPQIAAAVADATGRTIRIDGPIHIQILPAIALQAGNIHLENPQDFETGDTASIEEVRARLKIAPLLTGRIVVEELLVDRPELTLLIDEDGNNNWSIASDNAATERNGTSDTAGGDPPFGELVLKNTRIVDGRGTLSDRRGGVSHELNALELNAALGGNDLPLVIDGNFTLNDREAHFATEIAPFDALLKKAPADITARLNSDDLRIAFDSNLALGDTPQGKGSIDIETASVSDLAQWLQTAVEGDTGALYLSADFEGSGNTIAINSLDVTGDDLTVNGSASMEQTPGGVDLKADLRSTMIDLDRYLPKKNVPEPSSESQTGDAGDQAPPPDAPASLDLAALRDLRADVQIAIDGVQARGLTVAPIEMVISASDGRIQGELGPIGLLGGSVSGSFHADATSDNLEASLDLTIDRLDLNAIPETLKGPELPLSGVAALSVKTSTSGADVDQLAANLIGDVQVQLQGHEDTDLIAGISQADITFSRPSLTDTPSLQGSIVYNGEPVEIAIKTDTADRILGGQPFQLDAKIDSNLAAASYVGQVLQEPVFSLDGELNADTQSVAQLSAWLGQPFPAGQPDPGALSAQASFQSDGAGGEIQDFQIKGDALDLTASGSFDASAQPVNFELAVKGDALDLTASGSFDASAQPVNFELAVKGGVLDLDRYIAQDDGSSNDEAEAQAEPGTEDGNGTDLLAALSDEPIDTSALRQVSGSAKLALEGVQIAGLNFGPTSLNTDIADGNVSAAFAVSQQGERSIDLQLNVGGGEDQVSLSGMAIIDTEEGNAVLARLAELGFSAEGNSHGEIDFSANGASVRALVSSLAVDGQFSLPGMALAEGPVARIANLDGSIELAGVDAGGKLSFKGEATSREGGGQSLPVAVDVSTGAISAFLAGETISIELATTLGEAALALQGEISSSSKLDALRRLDLSFEAPRLNDLAALTGQPMPPAAPVSFTSKLATEEGSLRASELAFTLGSSSGSGNLIVDSTGDRPNIIADLKLGTIDVADFTIPAAPTESGPSSSGSGKARVLPDDPLPLDALSLINAKITMLAEQVRLDTGAEIENVDLRLTLEDGVLQIKPLTGGVSGGRFVANIDLDSTQEPAALVVDFSQDEMLLGYLLPILKEEGESVGRLDAEIKLQGRGNSIRQLAATTTGKFGFSGQGGSIDSSALRWMSLGLTDILNPIFKNQGNTYLNCGIGTVDFVDGLGTVRVMLVDMPSISIGGNGTIDLRDEKLDLSFNVKSKSQSLLSLVGPFDVHGTFADPKYGINAAGTAFETAVNAGVTAGMYLNPFVALGAVAAKQLANATDNPCVNAMEQAQSEAAASDSGKKQKPSVSGAIGSIFKGVGNLIPGGN